jgi:surface antigen
MRNSAIRAVGVVLVVAVAVTGCAAIQDNPKTDIGAVGGAAVGGLISAAAGAGGAGIAAGVLGGALLGGVIGNFMDQRDKQLEAQAAHRAFETVPSGTAVPWNNPDSGHSGAVMPTKTYQTASGTYCREYQQTALINGKEERAYGKACRQPDGSWKVSD